MSPQLHRFFPSATLAAILLVGACGAESTIDAGSDTTMSPDESVQPVESDGGTGETPFAGVPFFGGNDDQCPSTVLSNSDDDQAVLQQGADCFLSEVEAGTPVVWDLSLPTVEGDPIFTRHLFDGEAVWLLGDSRADEFGRGTVSAQRCAGIEGANWEPVGVDCVSTDYPGFSGFPEAD